MLLLVAKGVGSTTKLEESDEVPISVWVCLTVCSKSSKPQWQVAFITQVRKTIT